MTHLTFIAIQNYSSPWEDISDARDLENVNTLKSFMIPIFDYILRHTGLNSYQNCMKLPKVIEFFFLDFNLLIT